MSALITRMAAVFGAAGAGVNTARRAANALANYDARFTRFEAELTQIKLMLAGALFLVSVLVIKAFAG